MNLPLPELVEVELEGGMVEDDPAVIIGPAAERGEVLGSKQGVSFAKDATVAGTDVGTVVGVVVGAPHVAMIMAGESLLQRTDVAVEIVEIEGADGGVGEQKEDERPSEILHRSYSVTIGEDTPNLLIL